MSGFAAEVDAAAHDIDLEDQQTCAAHRVPMEIRPARWRRSTYPTSMRPLPRYLQSHGRGGAERQRNATQSRVVSKNKAAEWSWKDQIVPILTLIAKVLKLKTSKIWTVSEERDTFIGRHTVPAYHATENEQYMKSQLVKLGVYKVIRLAVKHHGHAPAAQTSITQSLQYYEHLSEPMAECLNVLLKKSDHAELDEEILCGIAAKSFNAQDTKGPRNFSMFLTQFTEWAPRAVLKQISLLISPLDSEVHFTLSFFSTLYGALRHTQTQSYLMRIAIVEIIACLIACSENLTSDAQQTQKQLNGLYDLHLELSTFRPTRLCDLPVKFPKKRLAITRVAVSALEDKVAGVRRNGISLIVKLMVVVTHPYRLMHGGFLGMEEWEDRYREVVKELQKTEKVLDDTLSGNTGEADRDEAAESSPLSNNERRNKNAEDAMDVGEDGDDSDKVDSIMDEDEPESSRAEDGGETPLTWTFALAEQAIITAYALGDQPEVLSNTLIKILSRRAFRWQERPVPFAAEEQVSFAVPDEDAMDEDPPPSAQALISTVPGSTQRALTGNTPKKSDDTGDAFELSQLLFVVGHVVVKHIVYSELVECEWKRQEQEKELDMCLLTCMNGCLFFVSSHVLIAEKLARGTAASKDGEELDQVAGNAEDEIGHRIATVRETGLLYGHDSLLAIYGPLLVRICGRPDKFKHVPLRELAILRHKPFPALPHPGDVEGPEHLDTIVDENSDELYRGLSNKDLVVNKNTPMVLTHLILNGMIKVKGQLGKMAKCLVEDEE
ncbi:non-SMC mitotic condensation complex subunit 1 [Lactifluus volemus]|nr:non-SMC mitotic condensation complex subunit 1 [Lactifluus volemus]